MSGLYAGITFSKGGTNAAGDEQAATSQASAADKADAARLEQEAAAYAAKQAEQAAKDQADAQKKAALAFGPAIRRKPAGQAAKAKTGNVFAAASTSTLITPQSLYTSSASTSQQPSTSGVVISDPAVPSGSVGASSSTAAPTHVLTGRTLIVPPSMTLDGDDDINGFKSTAAGKKAANKAKKRSKKNKKEEDPSLAWNAEYDPARPTDYNEYKAYAKAARTERRTQLRREKERQKRLKEAYNESGSSDYTDSDEDSDEERRRRIAKANNRFFAPPTTYDESASNIPASVDANAALAAALKAAANIPIEINEDDEDDPYRLEVVAPEIKQQHGDTKQEDAIMVDETEDSSEPVVVTEAAADDWAAWAAAPKVDDDPWARRQALASGPSAATSTSGSRALPSLGAAPPVAAQPFLQFHQSSSAAAASAAPSLTVSAHTFVPSSSPLPPPLAFDHLALIPGLASTPSMSPSPSPAPLQTVIPHVAPAPASTSVSIEEAQAKARAIAARLAMFKQPAAATSSTSNSGGMTPLFNTDDPIPGLGPSTQASAASQEVKEPSNPEDFAKNLMAKYGWTKGQGLGASSQGIINPLALSNASDGKKGGKGKGKQQESSKPAGHTKVLGMATAKGRVVSDIKTEKDKAEKEKYGEPSRIVCLSNMVGRNEVDAELAEDVAGEARKLGVLESCFVHIMPAYVSDEESVRVFVVFSGLVGAWKAVKEFDGRFFGGRTVTAKFYDERAYDARALHL